MKIVGLDLETTGVDVENGSILEIGLVGYDTNNVNSLNDLYSAPKLTILIYHQHLNNANIEALALNKELIAEIAELANRFGDSYSIENRSFAHLISNQDNHEVWLVDNNKATFVMLDWLVRNNLVEKTKYFDKVYNENPNAFIDDLRNRVINSRHMDGELIDSLKYMFKGITVAGKNVATFDIPYLRNNLPFFKNIVKVKHRMIDPSIVYTVASDNEVPNLYNCMKRIGFTSDTAHRAVEDVIDVLVLIYFHFKKSPFKVLFAIDVDGEVVAKEIFDATDKDGMLDFKTEYNECAVLDHLQLHKLAVEGRLDAFNKEVKELQSTNPLFIDKSVRVIHGKNEKEKQLLVDLINSKKYQVKYHKVFSAPKDSVQVNQHGKYLEVYHNFDTYNEDEIIENIKNLGKAKDGGNDNKDKSNWGKNNTKRLSFLWFFIYWWI